MYKSRQKKKKRGEKKPKKTRSNFQGIIKTQKAEFLPYWIVFAQEHSSPKANPETVVNLWHMTRILRVYSRLQQTEMTFRQLKPHPLSYVLQGKIPCLVGMSCCWVAEYIFIIIIIRDGKDLCGLCAWNKKFAVCSLRAGHSLFARFCIAWVSACAYFCSGKNRASFIAAFHRIFPA